MFLDDLRLVFGVDFPFGDARFSRHQLSLIFRFLFVAQLSWTTCWGHCCVATRTADLRYFVSD